jgi:SAM-dependent methyltransferase
MRFLGLALFALAILALATSVGCDRTAVAQRAPADTDAPDAGAPETGAIDLVLKLPETSDPPEYAPDRITKLLIDGRKFALDANNPTEKKVKVKPAAGKNTVKVVYDYWPNTYTNIIRTKIVKLEAGKTGEADLTKEDLKTPDKIKPIYFPTPKAVVEKMCEMAQIGKNDVVFDIGCGDGRLVIMAVEKFGAKKGVGIDINKDLIKECRENAKKAGVADKTAFRNDDALNIKDLSEASVVLLYLGDDLNLKMRPILQKTLKSGSRVVSHRFLMGDWKPDVTKKINAKNNYNDDEDYVLHLWKIK